MGFDLQLGHLLCGDAVESGFRRFRPEGRFSTSADFVHRSRPALALSENQMLRRELLGASKWSYGYFSLIDPNAADASFMTITDHPYMYYVRIGGYGDLRILFRQRVKLGWLAALHPAAGASGGASAGKP